MQSDVIIVTVGTPLKNNKPNFNQIDNVCKSLLKHCKKNQLIILKSTVMPGTTRKYFSKLFKKKLFISYSPERIAEGNALKEFKKIPIINSGINKISQKRSEYFWKNKMKFETISVSSLETAEMSKLADNAWIDLNIALANELAKFIDINNLNTDVLEVIKTANTLKKGDSYVNILMPSIGVGGYCLTKDPLFLHYTAKQKGLMLNTFKAGRKVNDSMPSYATSKILNFYKNTKNLNILIIGLSFKSNTGDIRFSPIFDLIKNLQKKDLKI